VYADLFDDDLDGIATALDMAAKKLGAIARIVWMGS